MLQFDNLPRPQRHAKMNQPVMLFVNTPDEMVGDNPYPH